VTGPTGPTVTANNLLAGNPAGNFITIQPNTIVPVDTFRQNGTAITETNGRITLSPNQQYYVDYKANISNVTPTAGTQSGAALFLNGAVIDGSNSFMYFPTSNVMMAGTLSGNTIITTGSGSNILDLRSVGVDPLVYGSTSVSVIKLA
jgi:hypothetical protein